MPKKSPTESETAADWEIVEDVVVHQPLGMVLSIRFDASTVETILDAAESLGLNVVELAKRAVVLAASDPALRERIARLETSAPINPVNSNETAPSPTTPGARSSTHH